MVTFGVSLLIGVQLAQADATSDANALSTMPNGVSAISDVFTIPQLTGLTNSANIQSSTNTANKTSKAVQVTNAANQVGAIWSNSSHKVDLSNNWTASMWMYFDKGSTGDGMAFVLQNVGTSAITSGLSATASPGQTLGVWGRDDGTKATTSSSLATRAIQKSWALEFDEYVNIDYMTVNAGFDWNLASSKPHIAWAYPGESTSYKVTPPGDGSKIYSAILNHNNPMYPTLSDGAWHHVTLDWTAPASGSTSGTMTYSFNDKDPSSGLAQSTTYTKTISIDITKLGLTASSTDKSVYWGFTGSTGTSFANNMIVFESVPGLVDGDADVSVTDTTQDKAVTTDTTVNGNDDLTYKYKLTYNSGTADWKSIAARLTQDKNVSFSSGTVTYANGDNSESFTSDELNDTTAIAHTLSGSLSKTNPTATLTLKGKAATVTSQTAVPSVVQYFNGSTFIGSVETPKFTILPANKLDLSMASDNATSVEPSKTINLQGQVTSADSTVGNKAVTMHVTLDNGNTIDNFTMNGTSSDSTKAGYFNFDLPASKLTTGANKVSVYAVDSNGNKSNVATLTVTLNGVLSFGDISGSMSFGTDNEVPSKEILIKASSDWNVNVTDGRVTGSKWYVYASASRLTSDTHTLAGDVVYVDGDGTKHVMTNKATLISSGASDGSSTATNIANGWSSSKGIFLNVQPSIYTGAYSGQVTWTLANTPAS